MIQACHTLLGGDKLNQLAFLHYCWTILTSDKLHLTKTYIIAFHKSNDFVTTERLKTTDLKNKRLWSLYVWETEHKSGKPDYLRCTNVYMCDRHVRVCLSNRLMKKRTTDRKPYFGFERKITEIFARMMQAWGSPNTRLIDQINLVNVWRVDL